MRIFIAIPLPASTKAFLKGIQEQLKESGSDVKWVETENIHLTLKFLGEAADDQLSKAALILEEVAKDTPSFAIGVSSLGAFPRISSPRIIWAGVDKGAKEAGDIAKTLEERLSLIGIPKEERGFSAHITIGRTRSGLNLGRLSKALEEISLSEERQGQEFTAARITLFQSTLTPKGPIYAAIKEADLATN